MKHTNDVNDVEEGQNVNTLSEIEEYYKAREQQLLKKLHQQGAALAAAEQALKQLTENQKVSEDETARQRAAREQQLKDELYRDPLTGIYNRRYYEEVARTTIGPAGVALMDVDDFKICNDTYGRVRMFQALTLKQPDGIAFLSPVSVPFIESWKKSVSVIVPSVIRKELRKQTVRLVNRMIFLREISHQKSLLKNA